MGHRRAPPAPVRAARASSSGMRAPAHRRGAPADELAPATGPDPHSVPALDARGPRAEVAVPAGGRRRGRHLRRRAVRLGDVVAVSRARVGAADRDVRDGQSTLVGELRARGHTALDADEDGFSEPRADGRWGWRADRVAGCSPERRRAGVLRGLLGGAGRASVRRPGAADGTRVRPRRAAADARRPAMGSDEQQLSQVLADLAKSSRSAPLGGPRTDHDRAAAGDRRCVALASRRNVGRSLRRTRAPDPTVRVDACQGPGVGCGIRLGRRPSWACVLLIEHPGGAGHGGPRPHLP